MRRPLEDQRDLGHPAAQPFSGTKEERHARPAAGVDLQRDRRVRLGGRVLGEPLLLEQPDDLLAALPSRGVLAARGGLVQRLHHLGGRENLDLLGLQFTRPEAHRLLHRGQRQQLQQVILDDVAGRADTVVVATAAAEADVLGHRDLDAVDVVVVPDRLVQLVGEAQRQDVLDRLLAEVVVDAEHRLLGEDAVDHRVEISCALQIVSERLLDDHPAPGALGLVGQSGLLELLRTPRGTHSAESTGRRRDCRRCRVRHPASAASRRASRTPSDRRKCPVRTGFPRPAGPRPPGGTGCGRVLRPRRRPASRNPRRPSRVGRTRRARSWPEAARGWRGRRSRASASCAPGHRSHRR